MGEQIETCILFSDIRDFTEYTAKKGDQQSRDRTQQEGAIGVGASPRATEREIRETHWAAPVWA